MSDLPPYKVRPARDASTVAGHTLAFCTRLAPCAISPGYAVLRRAHPGTTAQQVRRVTEGLPYVTEVAVPDGGGERGPRLPADGQHAAVRVLGVTDGDHAVRQVSDLNAVPVGATVTGLPPRRAHARRVTRPAAAVMSPHSDVAVALAGNLAEIALTRVMSPAVVMAGG